MLLDFLIPVSMGLDSLLIAISEKKPKLHGTRLCSTLRFDNLGCEVTDPFRL